VFILADNRDPGPFRYFADKYTGAAGWDIVKMPGSQDLMVDMPNELAQELMKLA